MTEENKQETKHFWGRHLILDVAECDMALIGDQDYLKRWVKALVQDIDMVAYGEPQVVHFGHGEIHLAGNTVVQLIETSNIIAHFCDEKGDLYLDVFSCKDFDPAIVVQNIEKWFSPKNIQQVFLTRKA